MGHIQQGDQRQYFAHEAQNYSSGDIFSNALKTGVSLVQKANQSNLANYQIDLSTKFLAKNNEINTKYQADPTNPQREKEIQEAFDSIAGQYKINPLCSEQWSEIKNNVFNRYKTYNSQWQEQQQQTNIQTNLKNGYDSAMEQFSQLGYKNASVDEIRLMSANLLEGLHNGAVVTLGEVYTNEALKDFTHDGMARYITALATHDPLKAQELLKDEGVRNDIGRAETLEQLETVIPKAIENMSKKNAVSELCNALRALNSEEANKFLLGNADYADVKKFVETHKSLPKDSIEMLNGIYGISTKEQYYYDPVKKIITKKPETSHGGGGTSASGGRSNLIALSKLSKTQKEDMAMDIENKIAGMFYFSDGDKLRTVAKNISKDDRGKEFQSAVYNKLSDVATAQSWIDTAFNTGVITKDQRKNMMDKYIQPMSEYLEANLQDLDEKKGLWGTKLGYGRLKAEFNTDDIPSNHTNKIREQNSMLLTAQSRYYENLTRAAKKLGKNNIYELETLPKSNQEEIYKLASDDAINYAKKYGAHPEIFFRKEYKQIYDAGLSAFGIKDGEKVARQIAKKVYSASDLQRADVNAIASDVFMNTKAYKNAKAKEIIQTIINVNKQKREGSVLTDFELEARAKDLGLTFSQLKNDAYSKGVNPTMYLVYLEDLRGIKNPGNKINRSTVKQAPYSAQNWTKYALEKNKRK